MRISHILALVAAAVLLLPGLCFFGGGLCMLPDAVLWVRRPDGVVYVLVGLGGIAIGTAILAVVVTLYRIGVSEGGPDWRRGRSGRDRDG